MSYNKTIDYYSEIKKKRLANPIANVNDLITAGLEKVNSDPAYMQYGDQWKGIAKDNWTGITTPTETNFDIQGNIDRLTQVKQDAVMAGLQKSKDSALSNLSSEQATIQPMYYDKRNQASATSQLGAKSFAEYLANRGEINSGVNDAATIVRTSDLQGQIGSLNRQEVAANTDISRRTTDTNNAYLSDIASSRAGLEAAALEQKIAEMQQARSLALNQQNLDRQFNYGVGRDTIGDTQYADTTQYNRGRDTVADTNYADTTQYNRGRDTIGDTNYANEVAYKKEQDILTQSNWQKNYTMQEKEAAINNEISRGNLSVSQGNAALNQAKFEAELDPNSLDNQYKRSTIDANNQSKTDSSFDKVIQRFDSLYTSKDPFTNEVKINPSFSAEQMRAAIIGMNLDDSQTDALLLRYGLPINQ